MSHYLQQNRSKFEQSDVSGVIVPRAYFNAVLGIVLKVGCDVVHDDRLCKITPEETQIFQVHMALFHRVLSVQSVRYQIFRVELVEHPVCIVLHGGREYDNLVGLAHLAEELMSTRSDQEVTAHDLRLIVFVSLEVVGSPAAALTILSLSMHLYEMDQRLVEVKNQRELLRSRLRLGQVWWLDLESHRRLLTLKLFSVLIAIGLRDYVAALVDAVGVN